MRNAGDPRLFGAISLYRQTGQLGAAYTAAASIRKNMALAPSIDNFLDARKEDAVLVEIGKLAIANQLLRSERASTLAFNESNLHNRLEFSRIKENWLTVLFRLLVERRDYTSFLVAIRKIKFVCFNYDRIIERFFFLATESYFEVDPNQVAEDLSSNLSIVHPYGVLGRLRSQVIGSGFGADVSGSELGRISAGIRTFTEGVLDVALVSRIQEYISSSDVVCFLGFAFHPMNVGILQSNGHALTKIVGTSRGLSTVTEEIVAGELKDVFGTNLQPEFISIDAAKIVSHYAAFFSGR